MLGCECSDSLQSSQTEELVLHLTELTSKLKGPQVHRITRMATIPLNDGEWNNRPPPDLARLSTRAGSYEALGCSEAQECLEDADCSSVETQEGFVAYQSPLSLAPQSEHRHDGGGAAGAAGRLPALAEQLPPLLAGDPDLAEMLSVLCDSEAELQPSAAFMEQHSPAILPELFLDASMRCTAVSWLVEVVSEFGLHQETLFLAIVLLDRFLSSSKGVPRTQLQLLAVACMLIASKHEEEVHPSVLDFTSIADNCFKPGDLLRMEAVVLDCLSFRINTPTAHTFLSMYKQALGLQPRTCALASYLAELATLEYDLLHFLPSHVASAATLLAQMYMGETHGISHLTLVTRYSVDQLKPCLWRLLALQRAAHSTRDYASPYMPVRDKYRGPQWLCVACTTPYTSAAALAAALKHSMDVAAAPSTDPVGGSGSSPKYK